MIGLSAQKFPEGSRGPQIDALARQHLWNKGLDYLHGPRSSNIIQKLASISTHQNRY